MARALQTSQSIVRLLEVLVGRVALYQGGSLGPEAFSPSSGFTLTGEQVYGIDWVNGLEATRSRETDVRLLPCLRVREPGLGIGSRRYALPSARIQGIHEIGLRLSCACFMRSI